MAIFDDFDEENELDDSERVKFKRKLLDQLYTENLLFDCNFYGSNKEKYNEIVEKHSLQFYHRIKFKNKKRITILEVRMLAILRNIPIVRAKEMADDFNFYINMVHSTDTQQCINKLTRKMTYFN